jgi:hypothetical protein
MSAILDQNKNYNADFGSIFRSSAIFFIPKDLKTTISVSNYWDFKNDLQVGLLFSIRSLSGKLIERRERYFSGCLVINESDWPVAEGSVEIEAFGNKNLRIPYAAIMGIYESQQSITMIHSYGRNHNLIELEDRNCLTIGRESCWTLRSSKSIKNYAVFHNGHVKIEKQIAKFIITNVKGDDCVLDFEIPTLLPFQTYKFEVDSIVPKYKDWLDSENGWGTLHFENKTAFTRLLLIWEDLVSGEVQVTHSNFDYSEIQTNMIQGTKPVLMKWPSVISKQENAKVVVYPKFSKGNYKISFNDILHSTQTGMFIDVRDIEFLEFSSDQNVLPSRIVTGFSASLDSEMLPMECSMGIIHEKRPPKRFHWAVVSKKFDTQLFFNSFPEIYDTPDNVFMIFRLYSSTIGEYVERKINLTNLEDACDGVRVVDLFGEPEGYFSDDFGYVSMFSNFGGWLMYSSMTKEKSFSIEHSF